MAFYADRFRKPGEEDIWEELKQMLKNPPSEQEIAQKKMEEQAWIDSILDKAFPENPKPQAEPYLTYEDLLLPEDAEKYRQKQMALAQQKEKTTIQSKLNSDWKTIDDLKDIANQSKENLGQIVSKENLKDTTGLVLQLASLFPAVRGPKLTTQGVKMVAKGVGTLQKKLAPKIGKKLSQEISENLVNGVYDGASRGALEGFGRGLVMDENPFKTAAQDSGIGMILGATGGTIAANAQKAIIGKELKKINNLKLLRKKETDFYKDYIQGTKSRHPQIGDIEYTQSGLETVSKQPVAGRDFDSLKKEIKNAEYVAYEKPHHKKHGIKDNIKGFHKLKNKDKEFLIADTSNGAKYYMSKQLGDIGNRPSRVEPIPPNNIIPPSQPNLNPNNANAQANLGQNLNPNTTIKAPKSEWEWMEWLKRKRKGLL